MPRLPLFVLLLLMAGLAGAQVAPLPAPRPLDAPPADAEAGASGMAFKVIKRGPDASAYVRDPVLEYRIDGWSADGRTRFNSRQQGVSRRWVRDLAREQPGLARALLTTPAGETRRWWISAAAMGPGYPGMPALPHVFDVTVLGGDDPTRAPADLLTPPADAVATDSGLVYRVLARGKGGNRPGPGDMVLVHYTGWTTDGRVFDSSLMRGQRASFPLSQVVSGWREGVQLMARGDRFRFWIPAALAYGENPPPGAPAGRLVFDVTLYGFVAPGAAPGGDVASADPEALPAD
ncbi:FKBP-type peptidyl-prolyl cis-trans isomerase [Arenimonas caeni]|uniref:Peptidyl-prolyl cis-trans isomerase n=1 Tax=Arenimonas caeni TaxID=2058085 RepID=A0A2P6MBF8_9GAMM|nr:FKBP-type peptidyl-prolyl cis-trans isomerase [Arenimonas caeni]PRH83309.1 peptidylprolyl isomerase [Arenimonas caeni]